MSVRRSMPCLEGRGHKYAPAASDSPFDRLWQRCTRCEEQRYDLAENCGSWNCGDLAEKVDERWVVVIPHPRDMENGAEISNQIRSDKGACEWCIEKHRREDQRRERQGRDYLVEWSYWQGQKRKQQERQERENQWRLERAQKTETARQRALLRQGHRTLTAIRRHLHDPVSSRQQASRPEKTSQT